MRDHLEVREDKPVGLWSDRFRIAHVAGTIGLFPKSGKGAVRYSWVCTLQPSCWLLSLKGMIAPIG